MAKRNAAFQLVDQIFQRVSQISGVISHEKRDVLRKESRAGGALLQKFSDFNAFLSFRVGEFQIENRAGMSLRNEKSVRDIGIQIDKLLLSETELLIVYIDITLIFSHIHDLKSRVPMHLHIIFRQSQGVEGADFDICLFLFQNRFHG